MIGGGDDDDVPEGRNVHVQRWTCEHCGTVNDNMSLYGHLACANAQCLHVSPALRLCAELGLQLSWVLNDGDCFYHAVMADELTRQGRVCELNPNSHLYRRELRELREECAKQLTASDMRMGEEPVAVAVRCDVAEAARARRARVSGLPQPPLEEADYAPGAIAIGDWDAYRGHTAALRGRWADAQIEGPILAAKLKRSISVLCWIPPRDGGPGAGGLHATACQYNHDTEQVSLSQVEGEQLADMTHQNPDDEPVLLWYNNLNHYWAVGRKGATHARTGLTRALWAAPRARHAYREADAARRLSVGAINNTDSNGDAAMADAEDDEPPPPASGRRTSTRKRTASSRHATETLQTDRGHRLELQQEFMAEHSLHMLRRDEWPADELVRLARRLYGGSNKPGKGLSRCTQYLEKLVMERRAAGEDQEHSKFVDCCGVGQLSSANIAGDREGLVRLDNLATADDVQALIDHVYPDDASLQDHGHAILSCRNKTAALCGHWPIEEQEVGRCARQSRCVFLAMHRTAQTPATKPPINCLQKCAMARLHSPLTLSFTNYLAARNAARHWPVSTPSRCL